MKLLSGLRDFIAQQGGEKTYWIAYSGGMDSHVMLSLCHRLALEQTISFRVIHVNHGLSPQAPQWAQHCATVCAQYGFSLTHIKLDLILQAGDSVEEVARTQRYAAFAKLMRTDDVLLTAHHQDDQAETVLLQLFRGAGVKGLSAMPSLKTFAAGMHARPFLQCTRAVLLDYAIAEKLQWIEDESNANQAFSRNYLRHEMMPLLASRWPSVSAAIARSASHCADTQQLLDAFGLSLMQACAGEVTGTLAVSSLMLLPVSQQKLVLRTWIAQSGLPMPDVKKLASILQDVFYADWDRFPCVSWGKVELRRHRDLVYLMTALSEHDSSQRMRWSLDQPLVLPQLGGLTHQHYVGMAIPDHIDEVEVRFRQGGEMLALPGRGRLALKNLFQEWGVVPWMRDRLPLIYVNDELTGLLNPFLFD